MSGHEHSGGNVVSDIFALPALPSPAERRDPDLVNRLTRGERKTNRNVPFLDLEVHLRALAMHGSGICYQQRQYGDGSTFERRVFGVALGENMNRDGAFVAVNEEFDHPNPELLGNRMLRMTGYKIDFVGRLIVRSNPTFATREVASMVWPTFSGFGPFVAIRHQLGMAEITQWDSSRIQLPPKLNIPHPQSEATGQSLKLADEVDRILVSLQGGENCTIFDGFANREEL